MASTSRVPTTSILFFLFIFLFLLSSSPSLALNSDGALLLAFKYSIITDPLSVLDSWHYSDPTPCSWTGVTCNPTDSTVTALSLPNRQLTGSLAPDLGLIPHLQHLDLSSNSFNGSLPDTLFNSTSLQSLSLANNHFSGDLPPIILTLTSLNLSGNTLTGSLPHSLAKLPNLTLLSLHHNSLSGSLPTGFPTLELFDVSSNQFNGTLSSDLAGPALRYLNLSSNRFSGQIPDGFATPWPENATVDLSSNNFTGQIPPAKSLLSQKPESFAGNPHLCGKPLNNLCAIPSSLSNPPNATASISPAIAVIPKTADGSDNSSNVSQDAHSKLKPTTIAGIIVADLAGIVLLGLGLLYLYQMKKKKSLPNQTQIEKSSEWPTTKGTVNFNTTGVSGGGAKSSGLKEVPTHRISLQFDTSPSPVSAPRTCCCINGTSRRHDGSTSSEAESEARLSSESEAEQSKSGGGVRRLVMVDGETEMDMETLLKASAYILGASGSSIVYKAVLQSGTALAVRRLGGENIKRESFEGQVRGIAKLRHPNLTRVRGFYCGNDEKLIISDYVPNGSLASASGCYRKAGSSPLHLPFEVRLKIARGVARGLAYIHEKKFVHGNLKPSNILLTPEMEPVISDLGINWIITGNKGGWSGHQVSSRRSMGLLDGPLQDVSISGSSPYISPLGSSNGPISPYLPPEATKNLKPNSKWDVYSFGIVLLELLTGRVFLERELSHQWTPGNGLAEDRYWALRMADAAIKADVHGKEEAVAGIFKLGFQCANLAPQKRPSMKEALLVVERVPSSASSR